MLRLSCCAQSQDSGSLISQPFEEEHSQPERKSKDGRITPGPRTNSSTYWKSDGGPSSSMSLLTVMRGPLAFERSFSKARMLAARGAAGQAVIVDVDGDTDTDVDANASVCKGASDLSVAFPLGWKNAVISGAYIILDR